MFRQRKDLIHRVLSELGDRDREILTRFYLNGTESQEQICEEMDLKLILNFVFLNPVQKLVFWRVGQKKNRTQRFASSFYENFSGVFVLRSRSD